MSIQRFTYDDFEETRFRLISTIQERLTEYGRRFILGITRLEPDWSQYPFQDFPSVRWKIMNIKALKEQNEKKYMDHYKALERSLLQNWTKSESNLPSPLPGLTLNHSSGLSINGMPYPFILSNL